MGIIELHMLKMKSLIVLTLVMFVGSTTKLELDEFKSEMSSRSLCCLFDTSRCSSYCAGRSCSSTCTVRCGILLSDCGTFNCSEVSPDTCTTTSAPSPPATPATSSCVAAGEACTVGASAAAEMCCSPTTCTPNSAGTGGNCINTGGK